MIDCDFLLRKAVFFARIVIIMGIGVFLDETMVVCGCDNAVDCVWGG